MKKNKQVTGIVTQVYGGANHKLGQIRVFMDDRAGDVYFALSVHKEEEVMFKTEKAAHEYLMDMDEADEW
jgi:hypothetical protein